MEWYKWIIHTVSGEAVEECPYLIKEGDKITYGGWEYYMSHYTAASPDDEDCKLCLVFLPYKESDLDECAILRDIKLEQLVPTPYAGPTDELPF